MHSVVKMYAHFARGKNNSVKGGMMCQTEWQNILGEFSILWE
jgi:hypothetical protein